MATHGRSGFNRLLLGSVAEKVLRSSINPLLLIRASEETKSEGQAILRSVIVPLDGSELAEMVLSPVVQLADALKTGNPFAPCLPYPRHYLRRN